MPKPLRPPPAKPRGPAIYRVPKETGTGWETEPPPDFPGGNLASGVGQVSRDEWWLWQAFALIEKDPPRPWGPDYSGGVNWGYQVPDPVFGSRMEPGGQILDFVLFHTPFGKVGVRLQSELHIFNPFGGPTISRDLYSKSHLYGYTKVLDAYSQDFMHDDTGQAACQVARELMRGQERPNPIIAGTARRVR